MNKIGYFPGEHLRNNVTTFLEEHAASHPDRMVLLWLDQKNIGDSVNSFEHRGITAKQLYDAVGRVAAGFETSGICKGDRVVLFVPMSMPLYTAMFALQRIGAIPVFLDSWARRTHLGVSAKIVSPRAMVSFEQAFALCDDVPELSNIPIKICVGPANRSYTARFDDLMQTDRHAPAIAVEQEHTALITFTTGSSGTPKGADRTHRFLAAQHYALNQGLPYQSDDVDLPVFPIFSLNNLAAGVTTVIPGFDIGVPSEKDPEIILKQLQVTKTTCATLSPSLFNRLADFCLKNSIKLSMLRRIVTGGAPVSRDDVVAFQRIAPGAEIWILFGSTEVEPMAHIEGKEMVNLKTRASVDPEWVDEGVNVGHIVQNLSCRFLKIKRGPIEIKSAQDWSPLQVERGEVGELIVAGEHVCRNYYNDQDAFRRAKIFDESGTVWHRTGDLGRLDDQGYLWIVGRVHNAIQREGRYVFPVRAEMIMKKLPFVQLCAYLGIQDEKLGEKTVCVVVPEKSESLENRQILLEYEQELRRIMHKNGAPVDQVVFRDKIPMDPRHHSKVEYEVLRQELSSEKLV